LQGAVVGTITGNCRFYDASDNNLLRLETQIALNGKKSSLKRITSFQVNIYKTRMTVVAMYSFVSSFSQECFLLLLFHFNFIAVLSNQPK
jgi:hypothetical protein